MNQDELKKERKALMNLYGLFGASIVLSVIPNTGAAVLSFVFFIALMVMAYRLRKSAEKKSLVDNHATYVIRSLWIAAFISLITMIAAGIYIFLKVDPEPFQPCAMRIVNHTQQLTEQSDLAFLVELAQPCMTPFLASNLKPLIAGGAIAIAPLMLYVAYRFIYGFQRAIKGYRLADPLRWF